MKQLWTFVIATISMSLVLTSPPSFARMGGAGGGAGDASEMGGSEGSEQTPYRGMEEDRVERFFERMEKRSTGDMKKGGVRMDLEPLKYKNGVLEVRFFANTHVGNLADHDLMEQTRLHVNDMVIEPHSTDRMRGHHASGIMRFKVPERPVNFSITINGIPNMGEREFKWQ